MSDQHNTERARALRGCAELYKIAASHLEATPPNYEEAARAMGTAKATGDRIQAALLLDYVMTGGFQERLFGELMGEQE